MVAKHHFQHHLDRVSRQHHRRFESCCSRMPHHRGVCKVSQECTQLGTKSHCRKLQTTLLSGTPEKILLRSPMDRHGHQWPATILSMLRSSQDAPLSKEAERTATGVLNQECTTPSSRRAFIDRDRHRRPNKPRRKPRKARRSRLVMKFCVGTPPRRRANLLG
jgi:hypothetical protein